MHFLDCIFLYSSISPHAVLGRDSFTSTRLARHDDRLVPIVPLHELEGLLGHSVDVGVQVTHVLAPEENTIIIRIKTVSPADL